ncbi:sterol desaturase family protein [Xanthobacter autotrophicus]|uniref:sterol desaturase family protein n=1 Tax=Xanthobacter autotrophicus TaxID=280 RepID=UPI001E629916|nr:sterol desaturase family protein [Xanthobacter autotrophicus]UDQ89779.1 sterol desaturase family protein [Xanthobacter autotrophicus]
MFGLLATGTAVPHPFAFALLALALMLVEYLFHRLNHHDSYDSGETAASLAIAVGHKVIEGFTVGIVAAPVVFVSGHRLFDIPMSGALAWIALFLGVELSYYFHHFAMHKVRWLWATHAVHHSATRLNLSAAVRLGWGGHLTGGFVFYLPLVLIGFPPLSVFGMLGASLVYQFFLHLAAPPHLGPLEWVLNTPRHHHVHHAANSAVLDSNFGGVLIIFDRMFGTFAGAPKGEPLVFGVAGVESSLNPIRIVSNTWVDMYRQWGVSRGVRARLRLLFGPPG